MALRQKISPMHFATAVVQKDVSLSRSAVAVDLGRSCKLWLFSTFGFFSIVQSEDPAVLIVRARAHDDLKAFLARASEAFPAFATEVHVTPPPRDYPFRAFVPREVVAEVLCDHVTEGLTYDNFKGAVGDVDPPRAMIYHDVWEVMRRGLSMLRPSAKTISGASRR